MKRYHLDAGELRHAITLFMRQELIDDFGGREVRWIEKARIWSRILPATIRTASRGERQEAVATHFIDARQPLDIEPGMRIFANHSHRNFIVLSVLDPDETGRYWRCNCREEPSL